MVKELDTLRSALQSATPGAVEVTSELRRAWDYGRWL